VIAGTIKSLIGNDLVSDVRSARQTGLHVYWVPDVFERDVDGEPHFALLEETFRNR
jgi:hypothetical protein